MKHCLPLWLLLLLLLHLPGAAWATAGPPATGRPLAEALNPDGTLRAGAAGSFDARAFRMRTAPDGRPVFRPAGTAGAGDERWADGFGLPDGTNGQVSAVVKSGANIYIGGSFTIAGGVVANKIAKWNGTMWSSLGTGNGNGLNGGSGVYALAVASSGDVYAGGNFRQAGGGAAYNVAKWNGTAWSSLGTAALNGSVYALAVAGSGEVYMGGYFTQVGGLVANGIAKWNGTAWSSLGTGAGNGVSGNNISVNALALASNGDVYVGGEFTQAGGMAASGIAKWSGTAWSSLGTGVSSSSAYSSVSALAVAGSGELYVGGYFTQVSGVAANNVARWNGTAWSSLGTGTGNGVSGGVSALAVSGSGDVYVGGHFTQAGGLAANQIARWNGTGWSSLGTGFASVLSNYEYVNTLAVASNGDLYVGSNVTQVGGVGANYLAKWNGTAWSPVGTGVGNGMNDGISALVVASNGDVYVGGGFTRAGGVAANHVAKWNGTAWSSLGTGTGNGVDAYVSALAVASNGDVYAGGSFTQAGGVPANYVAKWNGMVWSPLGTGTSNGMDSGVNVLAVASNGDVYAGGYFFHAGGVPANYVAKWNGTAWSSLGTGVSNSMGGGIYIGALAVAGNGEVYVGGNFTQAGGVAANGVAKWNGTAWSPLGTGNGNGVNGSIGALAIDGSGEIYVGGYFTQAGGVAANCVAKWNGTAWSSLGSGISANTGSGPGYSIGSLVVVSSTEIYAGGYFTQAGGVAANNVAKWDGATWSSMGTGLNEAARLSLGTAGKVYANGGFTATGDNSKVMAYFGIYDPNAPLATLAAQATPAAQLFPNPAHGTATLRLPAGAPRQPLALTDALGRLVRQFPAPAGPEAVLDLRGLPAGVYWVRCGALSQRLVVE